MFSGQRFGILAMFFLSKTPCSHSFTFQPCYLITLRWRWHIYLRLHQIRTRSEECAIALEQIPWPRLLEITGLIVVNSDSVKGGIISNHLFVQTGLKCNLQNSVSEDQSNMSKWAYLLGFDCLARKKPGTPFEVAKVSIPFWNYPLVWPTY